MAKRECHSARVRDEADFQKKKSSITTRSIWKTSELMSPYTTRRNFPTTTTTKSLEQASGSTVQVLEHISGAQRRMYTLLDISRRRRVHRQLKKTSVDRAKGGGARRRGNWTVFKK